MRAMRSICRGTVTALALTASVAGLFPSEVPAQARRNGVGDLREQGGPVAGALAPSADQSNARPRAAPSPSPAQPGPPAPADNKDPREGDAAYEQARRLMQAIEGVLQDAAKSRADANRLPSKDDFLVPPIWTETREDREQKIRNLLDAALGIITDVPIVEHQKKVEVLRKNIRELEQRIEANRSMIKEAKSEIHSALVKTGIQLSPEQVELLLESVLSGDLVRLVAVFNSAKLIDGQLAKLMHSSSNNLNAARK